MILSKVACMSINLQRRQAIIVRNPMGIEMEKAGDQRHPRPPQLGRPQVPLHQIDLPLHLHLRL